MVDPSLGAQSAESADVRAERDEFLRAVVAELFQENTRWPGLWTRLNSLLAERDQLASDLARTKDQRDMAVIERDQAHAALGRLLTDDAAADNIAETMRIARAALGLGVGS